jgi:hypothetical protein
MGQARREKEKTMKKKEPKLPPPYASETRDARYAGTFEVLVPVPERNKPHKVPQSFPSMQAAEAWMHSPEGKDAIAEILKDARKK